MGRLVLPRLEQEHAPLHRDESATLQIDTDI